MKIRKFVQICAFLCICIITGFITANIIAKPIVLTFSNSPNLISVNEPLVSFSGCFLFYGIFFGSIIYVAIHIFLLNLKVSLNAFNRNHKNSNKNEW